MKIVADHHIPFLTEYFGAGGELVLKPGRAINREDVRDADILLVRSVTKVDEKLLSGSRVKFVGSVTAGADHLDVAWLNAAGIAWSVANGFNAPPVADYVVSVIAALQRKHVLAKAGMRAAVIGVGNVGRLVAERLALLNMEVIFCDPLRKETEPDFHSTPLEDIAEVDLISLHVPLTHTGDHPTRHFIDKSFLQRQKHNAVLLNASRGAVIDAQALMLHGTHLHWCFDVWEHEPNIDKNVLNRALIATPHIAGYSVQSKIRGIEMIYQAACAHKIIEPTSKLPLEMPTQALSFSGAHHHWQDIVLGVFNPLILTAMMRAELLPETADSHLFDEMRNKFNYRHEFRYTNIVGAEIEEQDQMLLTQLGLSNGNVH